MTSPITSPQLVKVAQAAQTLGVSTKTIYRLVELGELDSVRVGAHALRIPLSAIVAYIGQGGSSR